MKTIFTIFKIIIIITRVIASFWLVVLPSEYMLDNWKLFSLHSLAIRGQYNHLVALEPVQHEWNALTIFEVFELGAVYPKVFW